MPLAGCTFLAFGNDNDPEAEDTILRQEYYGNGVLGGGGALVT
jgi:hypothetical protein